MNQYHIYDQIGRGSNSVVYKGRKKQTVSYFAIKKVKKEEKARVLQEVNCQKRHRNFQNRLLCSRIAFVRTFHMLHHDNVLKFHEWYETSNHLWLILEYCVGGDLLALLKQDVQLPEESIHDFGRDCAHALQFLHSNGIIYGDLKPSNVLLDENGRPKLCDFGLSRRLADIANTSHVHLPQAKRGTPCYMAPELLQDEGVHSFSSDLWSLGCVMYECYYGQPPFSAQTLDKLLSSILLDELPPLPGNPSPEFQDLLHRLLAKDPAQRIGWDELRTHAFWRQPIRPLSLPPQPAFEYYLQRRSTVLAPPAEPAPEPAEEVQVQEQRGVGLLSGADGCSGIVRERGRELDNEQDIQAAPNSRRGHKGLDNPAGRSRERHGGGGSGEGREALADVPSAEVNALDGAGRLGSSGDKIGAQGWESGSGGPAADIAGPGMGALGNKGRQGAGGGSGDSKLSGSGGSHHGSQQVAAGGQGVVPSSGDRVGSLAEGTGYPAAHQDSAAAVRALRLSRIARTNLEKDADAEDSLASYRHGPSGVEVSVARSSGREDIILENNDLEFDFGVRQGGEGQGEGEPDGGEGEEGEEGEDSEVPHHIVGGDAEYQESGERQVHRSGISEEGRVGTREDGEEQANEIVFDEGPASMCSTGHIELDLTSEARQSASVNLATRSPARAAEPEGPVHSMARATEIPRTNSSSRKREPQDPVPATPARRQAAESPGAATGGQRENGAQQRPGDAPWSRGSRGSGGQATDGPAEEEGRLGAGVRPGPGKGEDRQEAGESGTDRSQGAATGETLSGHGSGAPVGPVNSREEVQRQVEGCMWHESDFAVRSVVLNVTIEQLPAPTFDARHVPSNPDSPRNPYTAEDIIQMSAEEQVKLFGNLAARLRRPAASDEHVNCIRYIQSLAHSKGAANILIASPLMTSIVRCLSSARTPASRIELCSAVGLLVRQATEIPDQLAGSGIVSILTEAVRDGQVRRRAMAALGELVFYIATRNPQPVTSSSSSAPQGWQVPATTISVIASMLALNTGSDDVTQHYAVKTIENVAGEGPAWASRFATPAIVADLARIFRHPSSRQHLRACAGSALVRLLRHSPSLATALLDALGTPWKVAATLKRSSPRELQPLLNILNLLLLAAVSSSSTSSAGPAAAALPRTTSQSPLLASIDDRGLLQALIGLLENNGPLSPSSVVKGKALVSCGLLCRLQPSRWVPALQSQAKEQKSLALAIERLSKDKDSYVLQCLDVLAASIASCVPGLIKNVGRDLTSINAMLRRPALGAPGALANGNGSVRGKGGSTHGRGPDSQPPQSGLSAAQQQAVQQGMKRALEDLHMILKLLNSSLIRPRIVQGDLISSLARFIGHSHSPFLPGQHELQTLLMQAVEALCLQPQQLLQHLPELRNELLPALTGLYSKSKSVEMRFLAFMKLCNLVSLLLDTLGGQARALGSHESDPGSGTAAGAHVGADAAQEGERVVRDFVQHLLLPLFPILLHEKDEEMLLPTYAQKMLVNLLDRGLMDPEEDLQRLNLTGRCFELLLETENFSAVNMHSLRLCLILAALPQVTLHNATDLKVFSRLGALLEHVVSTPELDEFVDPVVSLCFLVLDGHLEEVEGGAGALAPTQDAGEWAASPTGAAQGAAAGKEKLRASLAVRRRGWGGREEMKGEEEEKTSQGKILQDINQMARYSHILLQLVCGENELVAGIATDCLQLLLRTTPAPVLGKVKDSVEPSILLRLACGENEVVAEIATDCLQLLLRTTPAPVLGAVKDSIEDVSTAISSAATRLRPELAVKQELVFLEAVAEACQEELRRRRTGVPAPGPGPLLSPLSTPSRRHGTGKVCCWTRAQLAGLRDAVKGLRATAEGDATLLVIEQLQQDGIFN